MPEIDQTELDTLKVNAGKVEGLEKQVADGTAAATKATASYTSLEESSKAATEELDKLKTVNDEALNKKAADDAELTKLRAVAEKSTEDENALVALKTEKETVEKELSEFKEAALKSTRERLVALGIKEEDTKDKEMPILQAMEAGAIAVKSSAPVIPGTGAGLGGGSGNPPPASNGTVIEQNVKHIEALQAKSRSRATKIGG